LATIPARTAKIGELYLISETSPALDGIDEKLTTPRFERDDVHKLI
jgi:hypothetical protein